ncbi:CHAD domain-containing protein [Cellulomonas shaoxiangyii]|uniref:CHAD domain-containing protein n=1 Tax=Cellulomonas shaoxiangyii TaxID=2566013 RepID=UPI001094A069|nr:CHAD domain-containing protein [Cellulomonas shaoxiangyii]TGY77126.1 CHAD domain-containing protein [Cellulomonas shaoxiangyii]
MTGTSEVLPHAPTAPRDGSAREHVRAYVAAAVAALVAADPALAAGDDEAVHDARVATRRLRTALGDFAPVLDRARVAPVRADLRTLGRLLGDVRDPAVERHALLRRLADEPVELVVGPVRERVDDDRRAAQRAALGPLRAHLASGAHRRTLAVLAALAEDLPPGPRADEPADRYLARRARRAWRRFDAAVGRADALPPGDLHDHALHDARKDARRARYASELASSAVGDRAARAARRAATVQAALGEHHDARVRQASLRRMAMAAYLDGQNTFTFGRLHALAQAEADAAERDAAVAVARARRGRGPLA